MDKEKTKLDWINPNNVLSYIDGWNAAIEAAANIAKPVSLNDMPVECRTYTERLAHDVRQVTMENIRKLKK